MRFVYEVIFFSLLLSVWTFNKLLYVSKEKSIVIIHIAELIWPFEGGIYLHTVHRGWVCPGMVASIYRKKTKNVWSALITVQGLSACRISHKIGDNAIEHEGLDNATWGSREPLGTHCLLCPALPPLKFYQDHIISDINLVEAISIIHKLHNVATISFLNRCNQE